jgi:hypothetical protein
LGHFDHSQHFDFLVDVGPKGVFGKYRNVTTKDKRSHKLIFIVFYAPKTKWQHFFVQKTKKTETKKH